ncbi:MAG: hypothetical protein ACRD2L_25185, partial [Terriglobia bacterium]
MPLQVSDAASHRRDQIANLAELLRNRPTRQLLVKAVYFGKQRYKSVRFLAKKLSLPGKRNKEKQVTEIAKPLVNSCFGQERQ